MKCLDTDILIDFIRGEEDAVNYIRKIKDKGEELATTWVNSCEILKGAYSRGEPQEISGIHNLLNSLYVLLPTIGTSELYAQLYSRLKHKGKIIGDFDLIISSIAIENDVVLISCDKDFESVSELKIEKWR